MIVSPGPNRRGPGKFHVFRHTSAVPISRTVGGARLEGQEAKWTLRNLDPGTAFFIAALERDRGFLAAGRYLAAIGQPAVNSLIQTLKDSRPAYKVTCDFFDGHVAGVVIEDLLPHNFRAPKCRYDDR